MPGFPLRVQGPFIHTSATHTCTPGMPFRAQRPPHPQPRETHPRDPHQGPGTFLRAKEPPHTPRTPHPQSQGVLGTPTSPSGSHRATASALGDFGVRKGKFGVSLCVTTALPASLCRGWGNGDTNPAWMDLGVSGRLAGVGGHTPGSPPPVQPPGVWGVPGTPRPLPPPARPAATCCSLFLFPLHRLKHLVLVPSGEILGCTGLYSLILGYTALYWSILGSAELY